MKIEKTRYVNATRLFPLEFDSSDSCGDDTGLLEEAYFYVSKEEATNDLERFDEPETRQIIPVTITYEF